MAFDYSEYPPNWKTEIRPRILERATDEHGVQRCEWCGVANHAVGARDFKGNWHDEDSIDHMQSDYGWSLFGEYPKMIRIVLTIAHIHDMDKMNCADDNLAALCQRCHLNHDRDHHIANRRKTLRKKRIAAQKQYDQEVGQLRMFDYGK
jgi:hypothetical protein